MKKHTILSAFILVLGLVVCLAIAGCGNVSLSGDALTAAQTSANDAYNAAVRAQANPASPAWESAYLTENYLQWRFFVRSAVKDNNWGTLLPSEKAATQPAQPGQ